MGMGVYDRVEQAWLRIILNAPNVSRGPRSVHPLDAGFPVLRPFPAPVYDPFGKQIRAFRSREEKLLAALPHAVVGV